jgi:Domain of Unknown Function (DUF1080).
MKRPALATLLALAFTFPLLAATSDWRPLPLIENNRIAPAWQHVGFGQMIVENNILRTEPDARGLGLLVYTKETFGDCQIRIVYRPAEPNDNAGVHIRMDRGILDQVGRADLIGVTRGPNNSLSAAEAKKMATASETENGGWYAIHHGFEVQIMDSGDALHRTGSIYSFAPADELPPAPADGWRTMIITLRGTEVLVDLDGENISRFDSATADVPPRNTWSAPKREHVRPTHGYIGLQTHDPGDIIYFKEVATRPLR